MSRLRRGKFSGSGAVSIGNSLTMAPEAAIASNSASFSGVGMGEAASEHRDRAPPASRALGGPTCRSHGRRPRRSRPPARRGQRRAPRHLAPVGGRASRPDHGKPHAPVEQVAFEVEDDGSVWEGGEHRGYSASSRVRMRRSLRTAASHSASTRRISAGRAATISCAAVASIPGTPAMRPREA